LNKNSDLLQQENIKLIATGTTSKAEKAGFKVKKMLSGPMEMRKLRRVAEGKTKMVLFFKDPLGHAHEVDINMLLRVCDVHNVPIATNEATAQLLLNSL
jgi:methylglyoxal synthase